MSSQPNKSSILPDSHFRTYHTYKIFLDRYSLKDSERSNIIDGTTVVFTPNPDSDFPRREIGQVTCVEDDLVTIASVEDKKTYLRSKAEIDCPLELNYSQMAGRVAYAISNNEHSEESKTFWREKFFDILDSQKFVPGGRILAGAGAPGDLTFFNCYVVPIKQDSRGGIMDTAKSQFEIMSRGGGVGINISILRPKYGYVKGVNGRSSGSVGWGNLYSTLTDMIEQGGSRRGALMLILDVWHPDIEWFIEAKHKSGFLDYANISVGVTDDFMAAVKSDSDWNLEFPDTSDPDYDSVWDGDLGKWKALGKATKVVKTVKAADLFKNMATSAWKSAEPGLFFVDRYNEMSNSHYYCRINTTNPCVTGDTRLATQHGLIKVEDLYVSQSDLLCTVDNRSLGTSDLGVSVRPAVPVFKTDDSAEVWEIETKAGYKIKATSWHDLYTTRGKIKVKDLEVGDELLIQSGVGQFGQEGNYDLGVIMGLISGDGYFSNRNRRGRTYQEAIIGLWGEDRAYSQDILGCVNRTISSSGLKRAQEVGSVVIADRDEERITSVVLAKHLDSYGFNKESKLEIPEVVWRGSKECVIGYLQGLFQADGTVNATESNSCCSVRLASSNRSHLEQVQLLISNFGILGKIYKRREAQYRDLPDGKGGLKSYYTQSQYELIIGGTNRETFFEEIGFFYCDRRELKYRNWVESRPSKGLPQFTSSIERITKLKGRHAVYDTTQNDHNSIIFNGLVSGNCGEQGLPPWGVCNLGAMNLSKFVSHNPDTDSSFWNYCEEDTIDRVLSRIDLSELEEATETAARFLDNVIDVTHYFIDENSEQQLKERRVGLGVMGLAEMLIKLGVPYGSEIGDKVCSVIFRTIRDSAYRSSIQSAKDKGPFPAFVNHKFLESGFAKTLPADMRNEISNYGIRNVTLTTVAPTGTTGSLSGTSTGLEPYFQFKFEQRGKLGSNIVEEPVVEEFREAVCFLKEELPPQFVTSDKLTPQQHLSTMAIAQKFIDASISKTCNLPNEATVEDVESFYLSLYDSGCKGGTVYRDGSRQEQCLVKVDDSANEEKGSQSSEKTIAVRLKVSEEVKAMPIKPRMGLTTEINTHLGSVHLTLNFIDGEPFDVFIQVSKAGSDVSAHIESIARLISIILRLNSGVNPTRRLNRVIGQLRGIAASGGVMLSSRKIHSIPDAIAVALKDLLEGYSEIGVNEVLPTDSVKEDPDTSQKIFGRIAKTCPSCGNSSAFNAEGCFSCRICGFSAC